MNKLSTLALAVAVSFAVLPAAFARDDDHVSRKNSRDEHVQVRADYRDHYRDDERRRPVRDNRETSHDRDHH